MTVGEADGIRACMVAATTVEMADASGVGAAAEGRLQAVSNRPRITKVINHRIFIVYNDSQVPMPFSRARR